MKILAEGRRMGRPPPLRPAVLWLGQACFLFSIGLVMVFLFYRVSHIAALDNRVCPTIKGCPLGKMTQEQVQLLHLLGIPLAANTILVTGLTILVTGAFCTVGAILATRRPPSGMAIFTALTLVLFGGTTFSGGSATSQTGLPNALQTAFNVLSFVGGLLIVIFFCVFPDGRIVRSQKAGWLLLWPVAPLLLFEALQAGLYLAPDTPLGPSHVPGPVMIIAWGTGLGSLIWIQTFRFRQRSDQRQRQQSKWVVYGISTAFLGLLISLLLFGISDTTKNAYLEYAAGVGVNLFISLIPLSIGFAILKYRLWDVDVLINRTLVYGSLTGLSAALYIGSVIILQAILRALTGQGSNLAIALSTLFIAAAFQPLRRRIQGFIDRRFYRSKYNAARTLIALQSRLRDDVDLDQLGLELVKVVRETVQPSQVSLWFKERSS